MKNKIMMLDDNKDIIETFDSIIAPFFYDNFDIDIEYHFDFESAREQISDRLLVVISDFNLGGERTGAEFYATVRKAYPQLPFVLFSAGEEFPAFPHDRNFFICRQKNWRLLRVLVSGVLCASRKAKWCREKELFTFG